MNILDSLASACNGPPRRRTGFLSIPLLAAWFAVPASAQEGMTVYDQACIAERAAEAGLSLNCTANDISIASAEIIGDPKCEYPGDEIEFQARFTVQSSATERYDIGLWFAEDGDPNDDGALTGKCTVSTLPTGSYPFLNLDTDSQPGDTCGDIKKPGSNPLYPVVTVKATCVDYDEPGSPGEGMLDLPYCTSWRQQGSNELCTTPTQAFPGAPSKCKCDRTFDVPILVPPAKLRVEKTAKTTEIAEPGGDVTFDVKIYNDGIDPSNAIKLDTLTDTIVDAGGNVIKPLGSLFNGDSNANLKATTCVKDATIAPKGGSYTCNFSVRVEGNAGTKVHDRVDASGIDQRDPPNRLYGEASAAVELTDSRPDITVLKSANKESVNEPGDDVVFTVTVTNTSPAGKYDPLRIDSLVDDVYGDLSKLTITSCNSADNRYPTALAHGGFYTCTFTVFVEGDGKNKTSETNIITAKVYDDDQTAPYSEDSNSVTVNIVPVGSSIKVVKDVSYNGSTWAERVDIPETPAPGVKVDYRVIITNTSPVDDVTIRSLTEQVNLNGAGLGSPYDLVAANCELGSDGIKLAKNGGSRTCTFSLTLYGNGPVADRGGDSHVNRITAAGLDDDGDPVTASDSASVYFLDVKPTATLTKTATRALVTYEVKVTNTSTAETLYLESLIDDKFGDVTKDKDDLDSPNDKIESTTCAAGDVAIGATYPCEFKAYVDNVPTELPHVNTVEAVIGDDEGNYVSPKPSNTATVDLE